MSINVSNHIANWDAYAKSFLSVMPSRMLTLNRKVASFLYGNVADFGCGAGKIIPFVMNRASVQSYCGIDCSSEMASYARQMIERFPEKRGEIVEGYIEKVTLSDIDSGLSINSYYTWSQPEVVLGHIHSQLNVGSLFVLVTLNADIDMHALLEEAELELIAHPHWAEFKHHNLRICQSEQVKYISLDELLGQVRRVGFKIEEANKTLYSGGLNFLILSKS